MKLVDPDPTALDFVAQPSEISAWRNKSKHDLIGHRRHEAVALAGEIGGDVLYRCWTRRDDCQPALVERLPLRSWQPQGADATRERHHDWLFAAQQDVEALLFERRMKAADHAAPGIAPCRRLIEGFEDRRTGCFLRAEEGRHRRGKLRGRTDDRNRLWGISAEPPDQAVGIGSVALRYELRAIRPFRARHGRFILPASEH